jgi:O-antigen ligase
MKRFFGGQPFVLACAVFVLAAFPQPAPAQDTLAARPSQVFLGSLEYGASETTSLRRTVTLSANQPWTIRAIDLSRAPGVSVQVLKEEAASKEIACLIDTRALSEGLPFGAFLRRFIRIETDLADSPQILVPVTGMLSINKTPRNFNTFVYLGQERWQGRWGTPNMAGSILATALILAAGLASAGLHRLRKSPQKVFPALLIGIAAMLLLAGLWMLGLTYSRGSWIAFLAGLGAWAFLQKPARLWIAGTAILFLLRLWLLPAGGDRLASATALEEDKSIANRLLVWQGALCLMGDHPFSGTGPGSFGTVFSRYYQNSGHLDEYSNALNDFLTWGAERGVLLLAVAVGTVACLLFRCGKHAWKKKDYWVAGPIAALLAMGVASSFSCLWFVRDYQILFWFSLILLLGYAAAQLRGPAAPFSQWIRVGLAWAAFMASTGLVFFTAAQAALQNQPTRYATQTIRWENQDLDLLGFFPSRKPVQGVVLYLPDVQESAGKIARSTLRPLAALGWEVWSPEQACPPETLAALIACLSRQKDLPFFLAGHHGGATEALQGLLLPPTQLPPVTAAAFQGPQFEPARLLAQKSCPPTLVFQSLYDDQTSANTAIRLQRQLQQSPDCHEVVLDGGVVSYQSESWKAWIQTLDLFFRRHAAAKLALRDQG